MGTHRVDRHLVASVFRVAVRFVGLAGYLASFVVPARAQGLGVVEGTVVAAETGDRFADVHVYVLGTGRGAVTDAQGRYRIVGVPAGERVVVAEYIGRSAARVVVVVEAGSVVSADFRLPIEALPVSEIVVSTTGEARRKAEAPVTIGVVAGSELRDSRPSHPSEVLNRIPGVWLSVTGGEGHTAAIRQPRTTNPVYLYLEDGVPTRSTGFFNHNALYEVNVPQADRIEVVKGPSTALYGSDAIGGVVDVGTRPPGTGPALDLVTELGAHGWRRALLSGTTVAGANGLRADLNLTRSDGWRDGTAYDRGSATLRWDRSSGGGSRLKTVASYSRIDQETAGSSAISPDDYRSRPTANYTPISYREVEALRLSSTYERLSERSFASLTPYFRWNTMEILPNWSLTYDPAVWEVGHRSIGVIAKWRRDFEPLQARVLAGVDVDWSPGTHFERQIVPVREGPVFTSYSPGDVLYDYDVTFRGVSPYLHSEVSPTERLRVTVGLRFDYLGYDYENRLGVLSTGRHRRPASGSVRYRHLSPKLGATYNVGPEFGLFAAYGHGFRAPSEGQLFRQGQAANTVGLRPVKADNFEVGVRGALGTRLTYEASAYSMTKTDDILSHTHEDGSTETTNAGETLHRGIELGLGAEIVHGLRVEVSYSYARHTYEAWRPLAGVDYGGNEMEDAPGEIVNVAVSYAPGLLRGGNVALEWARIGEYWMDAENTHRYGGHDLLGARLNLPLRAGFTLFGRVTNLTDARYAESAAYTRARGEEYAPGLPRTYFFGVQYRAGHAEARR